MKFSLKKNKVLIWILVVIFVIVLLNLFQKEVKSFFYTISSPIQKVFWRVGDRVSDFFGAIIKAKSLKSEVEELKLKNQELLTQIANLGELIKENKNLREVLGLELQKEFRLAISQIIGKDISQDFILINKGVEDGISTGMPVMTQQKVLVGRISDVYQNFSKVMLISNKKSSFDAMVQRSEKDISGVVRGEGNFKILFDLIPWEENLSQNDVIITSALGGIFPKGLLVGQIKNIKKSDVEAFQRAEIEPAFDISQNTLLFIILEF